MYKNLVYFWKSPDQKQIFLLFRTRLIREKPIENYLMQTKELLYSRGQCQLTTKSFPFRSIDLFHGLIFRTSQCHLLTISKFFEKWSTFYINIFLIFQVIFVITCEETVLLIIYLFRFVFHFLLGLGRFNILCDRVSH